MHNLHRNHVFQHYVAMLARLGHSTAAAGYDLALAFYCTSGPVNTFSLVLSMPSPKEEIHL
jgi:hypothetical protein